MTQSITVKQLNYYVKSLIEGDHLLADITVTGEISNLKNHYASGHLYFTLKDKDAAVRCVMFRSNASRIKFSLQDGMQVLLRGRASVFEKDGQYQFYAEQIQPVGEGDITANFEMVKQKLAKEGLFDASNKRALPKFPQKIAVITSQTGAAIQDIINVISRRWPIAEIILCSVTVQGETSANEMIDALERIYAYGKADVIIIGRGGGSAEDLWSFNSEALARKIYESPIPVISAVGHETDFTICDFVADLRAPTPSAAAELAVPDINELFSVLYTVQNAMLSSLKKRYNYCDMRFNALQNSAYFKNPMFMLLSEREQIFDRFCDSLNSLLEKIYTKKSFFLGEAVSKLEALSPLKVISRGFAAVKSNNKSVTDVNAVNVGDEISVQLINGYLDCTVNKKTNLDGDK